MPELTQSSLKKALHYNPKTGVFTRLLRTSNSVHVGDVVGSNHCMGYLEARLDGRLYLLHRLAWFYMEGEWPAQIDHANQIRNDNRWSNLLISTHAEDQKNQP